MNLRHPEFEITVVLRGGQEFPAKWAKWSGTASGAGKSKCLLQVEGRAVSGLAEFSLSNGWGVGKGSGLRLTEESQDALLEWARTSGRKIAKTPRSPGRKRGTKAVKVDPRQTGLFGLLLGCLLLTGCASLWRPLTSLSINGFDDYRAAAIVMALEEWCAGAEYQCPPWTIDSEGPGGTIQPGTCKREGAQGVTHFSVIKEPSIDICYRGDNLEKFARFVAHELGHALSLRSDHLEEGLAMREYPEEALGEERLLNSADRWYVMQGRKNL